MSQNQTQTTDELDDLLDQSLDALADMPSIEPFPAGAHLAKVAFEFGVKIGKGVAVRAKLTAVQSVELNDANGTPLNPGDTCKLLFFLKHENAKTAELGQGQFKMLMQQAATQFGTKTSRELCKELESADVVWIMDRREVEKDGKKRVYPSLKEIKFL